MWKDTGAGRPCSIIGDARRPVCQQSGQQGAVTHSSLGLTIGLQSQSPMYFRGPPCLGHLTLYPPQCHFHPVSFAETKTRCHFGMEKLKSQKSPAARCGNVMGCCLCDRTSLGCLDLSLLLESGIPESKGPSGMALTSWLCDRAMEHFALWPLLGTLCLLPSGEPCQMGQLSRSSCCEN